MTFFWRQVVSIRHRRHSLWLSGMVGGTAPAQDGER
jgi:hypothetical protein